MGYVKLLNEFLVKVCICERCVELLCCLRRYADCWQKRQHEALIFIDIAVHNGLSV